MKKLLNDTQESVDRICSGKFGRDNVIVFMGRLRELYFIDPIISNNIFQLQNLAPQASFRRDGPGGNINLQPIEISMA